MITRNQFNSLVDTPDAILVVKLKTNETVYLSTDTISHLMLESVVRSISNSNKVSLSFNLIRGTQYIEPNTDIHYSIPMIIKSCEQYGLNELLSVL